MRVELWWILGSGVVMSALALVGGFALLLSERARERLILPLVALAAGSLLGAALFHLLPEAVEQTARASSAYVWAGAGFIAFALLEQLLHWHHQHGSRGGAQPMGYLVLAADGLHNLTDGLTVGGAFLIDIRAGLAAWLVAAAHELPQELGNFGVLVHSGWSIRKALLYNLLSALTFLVGGVAAYGLAGQVEPGLLVAFGAGSFLYIASVDLLPELRKQESRWGGLLHLALALLGMGLLFALR